MDGFDNFFSKLTSGRQPYAYQRRMAERLAERDVLLTAPTGSGKTWAILAPFLHALDSGRPVADRVLYALPLRALANNLKAEVERVVARLSLPVRVTIQTGEQSEDEMFDRGEIVFTTIDQLLSSYLHLPLSLPRRLANINAGAIPGALVVFDEAHLLEPQRALQTLLHLMQSHSGLTRFVVATATFTEPARQALLGFAKGMVEEGPRSEEIQSIPVLAQKERSWSRVDMSLSAQAVRDFHANGRGRTLVVVNTVRKAQEIGRELLESPPNGAEILVLHSRFYPHDRTEIEKRLTPVFGPTPSGTSAPNTILVATQVVEAGLDLSADLLLTEVAPANALIQRAGRCARYAAPRHQGKVVVFDLDRDERGARRFGPYRQPEIKQCLETTWSSLPNTVCALASSSSEQQLLELALADIEKESFKHMLSESARRQRDDEVKTAWRDGSPSALRELVRDVRSVPLFLADEPPSTMALERGPISLSLPHSSWRGFLAGLQKRGAISQVQVLADDAVDESPGGTRWQWRQMTRPDDWGDAYCLPSTLVSYESRLGLLLSPSTASLPALSYRGRMLGPGLHYEYETYPDHVARVLKQAHDWLARQSSAIEHFVAHFGIRAPVVRATVLLAAGLHDVAKLSLAWQKAVFAWQSYKARTSSTSPAPLAGVPLAHTSFNPETDRLEQRRREYERPNHAVEGALAVYALVDGWLADMGCSELEGDPLRRAVLSAIAQHHSARARNHGSFELIGGAQAIALDPLLSDPHPQALSRPSEPIVIALPTPADRSQFERCAFLEADVASHAKWWPLASFVIRGLRLSDQKATAEGTAAAKELR